MKDKAVIYSSMK